MKLNRNFRGYISEVIEEYYCETNGMDTVWDMFQELLNQSDLPVLIKAFPILFNDYIDRETGNEH